MRAALVIVGVALWVGFLYFLIDPWVAGAWAVLAALLGALVHNELRRPMSASEIAVHVHGDPHEIARELDLLERAGGISVIGGARRGPGAPR